MSSRNCSLAQAAGEDRSLVAGAAVTAVFFVATLKGACTGALSEPGAWCWRARVGDISYSPNVGGDAPVFGQSVQRVARGKWLDETRRWPSRAPRPSSRTVAQARPAAPVRDPLGGVANQLAGGAQIELFPHVAAVGIDGLHRQVQALRDLARADAFTDQPEHFQLAVRERRDGIFVDAGGAALRHLGQE